MEPYHRKSELPPALESMAQDLPILPAAAAELYAIPVMAEGDLSAVQYAMGEGES